MRTSKIWRRVLGVEDVVVERVELSDVEDVLVAHVRPKGPAVARCSRCGRKCPGYDRSGERRRWRGCDLGTLRVFLEADAPRIQCPEHGVVVAKVPWARPASGFTHDFEQTCAWLVKHTAKSHVTDLMRVAWRTVDAIVTRVVADLVGSVDRLAGLRRIGIDEIAHAKGHRYLTVIVDHDTGRLVWAGQGRCKETLYEFFDLLGTERAKQIVAVSADAADWIKTVVTERCPQAVLCMDPFHVVAWATDAVDSVRRRTVNALRDAGDTARAKDVKGLRWALLKNPENQTGEQRTTVASIKKTNKTLYTAYLLKEQLREAFKVGGDRGKRLIAGLLAWIARCKIPEFIAVGRTIRNNLPGIHNALIHAVTNARVEATNTHIRQLTRRSYGFRSPDTMIAMATLTRGGLDVRLPGRRHDR